MPRKEPGGANGFLAGDPNIQPLLDLINTWIHIGQALVGSIGALAFIFELLCSP